MTRTAHASTSYAALAGASTERILSRTLEFVSETGSSPVRRLIVTHMDTPVERDDAPAVPSAVVSAKPAAPTEPCFPFQGPC